MSFCRRFCSEFKTPFFGINELDKTLDVNRSFQIGRGCFSWVGIVKVLTLSIAIATLVYSFFVFEMPTFYPAFLTPWGVFFCILQLLGSFLLTTFAPLSAIPNILVKLTWILYSIASIIGCCVVILYWGAVFNPNEENDMLDKIMTHGGTLLIVLLQGIFVDKIPFRLKHGILAMFVVALMSGWLALQNTVVRYNPLDNGRDDDAVYGAMKWREETSDAIIKTAVVIFAVVPVFSTLLWMISLPGRRYLSLGNNNDHQEFDDTPKEIITAAEEGML